MCGGGLGRSQMLKLSVEKNNFPSPNKNKAKKVFLELANCPVSRMVPICAASVVGERSDVIFSPFSANLARCRLP